MNKSWKPNLRLAASVLAAFAAAAVYLHAQGPAFFQKIYLGTSGACVLQTGSGTPEGTLTGNICDLYLRTNGSTGTTLYVKESGTATNTGWVSRTVTEKFWLPAARCQNVTAASDWSLPTADPAVAACLTGTNTQLGTLDFADGAAALSAQRVLQLPADWTGAVDVRLTWLTTATTGSAVWQVATICTAEGESGDPAFNAASTVTDAAQGTASRYNLASITGVTTTGCAAGETMFLKVVRDPAHASDDLAATARLVGIEVTTRRAQ